MKVAHLTSTRLVWASAILYAAGIASAADTGGYQKSYEVTGHVKVRVHADNGKVQVVTSDDPRVDFHVADRGSVAALRIGGKVHVDSQQNGDVVELNVQVASALVIGWDDTRLNIEVRMPHNADLELDTHDGSVDVSSLTGNIQVHSGDGSIRASRLAGTIDLNTNDGSIKVDSLKGDLRLRTGDGTVQGESLDGKCEVSSNDGSINVTGRFDRLDVKTDDGSVTVRAATGSAMGSGWSIRTHDGAIELAIPTDIKADLDASTRDGRVKSDLPVTVVGDVSKSQMRGTVNGGGPSLFIHSDDGFIHLRGV
jgi:hypothetical protein